MRIRNSEFGIRNTGDELPKLLLHCCCAPCASYVLEYLSPNFIIGVLFYNGNIKPVEEHDKREAELKRLVSLVGYPNSVCIAEHEYSPGVFEEGFAPFWDEPEGGRRCGVCFKLRLEETARLAKAGGYDYFTTTLSVSPHKDAELLNEIGLGLADSYGVSFLVSDFKKRDGFKRSVELSKQYGIYRQSYCGCKKV